MDDLHIRNGFVVDGTGAPGRTGRRRRQRRRDHRGRRRRRPRPPHRRRRRRAGDAGLRRHPHPLRRPGVLGQAGHAVVVARRDDGRHGQLRRRLRPGAPGHRGRARRADGGRRGHPRHRAARGHPVGLGVLRRVPRRDRHALQRRRRRPDPPRRPALLRDGRALLRRRHRRRHRPHGRAHPQALADGALGFSTSRFYGHLDKPGKVVPGTHASADEMVAIAEALADGGHGTMEIISDHIDEPDELAWIEAIARIVGRPITLLVRRPESAAASGSSPTASPPRACEIRPQVGARPASVLMTLEGTLNPMRQFPTYAEIKDLPFDEQRAALRDPAFRATVLADERKVHRYADTNMILSTWHKMYVLPDGPQLRADVRRLARRHRRGPGRRRARGADGRDGRRPPDPVPVRQLPRHLDGQVEAIEHPQSVFGLSDGGAHCGVLCDASVPTYMLAYMTRDRPSGTMRARARRAQDDPGHRAALRHARPRRHRPRLPGRRQRHRLRRARACTTRRWSTTSPPAASGSSSGPAATCMTVCTGEVTYEDGEHTGALPGRLVRGGR